MPYTIVQTNNPLAIAECQWASANAVPVQQGQIQPTVKFTTFTSCIGIIGASANGAQAIGIHLVMVDGNDNAFTVADVPTVTALMAGFGQNVCIVGQVALWEDNVPAAYTALAQALGNPPTFDRGDGRYAGGFNNV
ncbi:hypothetical protein, partial [Pseudomonas sp. CGJS7]|uniref:hypothetical protein n=1 Tax=Pseudomonas sp. CGJS7 TaxID=3109348 RepID=UPI003008AA82